MDVLGRGWTPSRATRTAVLVVIGVALVTFPMWGTAVGVGVPTYTYETAEVQFVTGEAEYPASAYLVGPVRGIDCYFGPTFGRVCPLEQAAATENVTATLSPTVVTDEPYVSNPETGVIYRRTAGTVDGETTYGLTHVPSERAIRDVAVPWEEAGPHVKRAVRTGTGTSVAPRPIDATNHREYRALFVERQGRIFVVTERFDSRSFFDQQQQFINVVAVLFGLLAFARGVRSE